MNDSLQELTQAILQFRDERDWAQFHTPRNLAAALSIEAAELQETLLWRTDAEIHALMQDAQKRERVEHEIADVLIYALLMADMCGIDPGAAIHEKLRVNAAKYPAEKARGRGDKYSELDQRN